MDSHDSSKARVQLRPCEDCRRLRALRDRAEDDRLRAADFAWRDNARCDAPEWPSRLSAPLTARERFAEGRLLRPCDFSFFADALPFGAGGSFTPAFRALESPMAIACFELRTPCFPSLTWWISSRTNSPACVVGAFPSRASSRARSKVSFSGMVGLQPHARRASAAQPIGKRP